MLCHGPLANKLSGIQSRDESPPGTCLARSDNHIGSRVLKIIQIDSCLNVAVVAEWLRRWTFRVLEISNP